MYPDSWKSCFFSSGTRERIRGALEFFFYSLRRGTLCKTPVICFFEVKLLKLVLCSLNSLCKPCRKIPVPAQRSGCWSSSRRRARGLFGVLVLLAYECLLRHGLEDYIMNAPRVDLISANKEGICSSVGYLALYLLAAELGSWLMWSNPDFRKDPDRNLRQWTKKVVLLALFGLVAIAATYCLHTSVLPSGFFLRKNLTMFVVLCFQKWNWQSFA